MPTRLRPTAPLASDAILVGDPGRALLLAQELLEKPKMSNHARGLWGYSGRTAAGRELSVQATGMGGPSAAVVLADLAELGVRQAVRVGTCLAFGAEARLGESLLPTEAVAAGGSAASFGVPPGGVVAPDPDLLERLLGTELGGESRSVSVASFDQMPGDAGAASGAGAADMQTLAVLARAAQLGIAAAGLLIVVELEGGEAIGDPELEHVAVRAGKAAAEAMSNPKVES